MTQTLDTEAVARLLGLTPDTIATYRNRYADTDNPCPPPAGKVGGHPYWTDPQAWVAWSARRAGRTGRPPKARP